MNEEFSDFSPQLIDVFLQTSTFKKIFLIDDNFSSGSSISYINGNYVNSSISFEMKEILYFAIRMLKYSNQDVEFITLNRGTFDINVVEIDNLFEKREITPSSFYSNLVEIYDRFKDCSEKKELVILASNYLFNSEDNIMEILIKFMKINMNITVRICGLDKFCFRYWNGLYILLNELYRIDRRFIIISNYLIERRKINMINYTHNFHKLREIGFSNEIILKLNKPEMLLNEDILFLNNILNEKKQCCIIS